MRRLTQVLRFVCMLQLMFGGSALAQAGGSGAGEAAADEPLDDSQLEARKKQASEHFRRGVELFQEEAYRAAVVEFERANELVPDYRLLYNIGQTKLQVADYLGAAQAFEKYLEHGGADVSRARREEVETVLAALRERVGRIVVKVSQDGAEVFLDDVSVGTSPLPSVTLVNVGRHRISARTADGANAATVIDVAGGDLQEVTLKLIAPKVEQTVVMQTDDTTLSVKRQVAIGLWIGSGVALAGAGATAFLASSASDELDKERSSVPFNKSEADDAKSSAQLFGLTTDVLAGVGVGLAVAGVVYWVIGDEDEEKKEGETPLAEPPAVSWRWGVGPGTLTAQGRF